MSRGANGRRPRIGLIWTQFSAYHVDRLEAVGRRLCDRVEVVAIEVASTSTTYAWEPSGAVENTVKRQIFPGQAYERLPFFRRFWGQLRELARCDAVFVGVAYSKPDIILIALILRLMGKQVVMMTASKFDDHPRSAVKEWFKAQLLSCFSGAIVGGGRQFDYVRYLGFRARRVLPGYNTVSMARVRRQAAEAGGNIDRPFADRGFVYIGRFVAKKNIETMLEAYAHYAHAAGKQARRLTMAGDGPLGEALRAQCEQLGIAGLVDFTGFLPSNEVSATLAQGLALVLVSDEEQWGLVINEALAVGLPVLTSFEVGAREALVRNLQNGCVVQSHSVESIARSFAFIAGDAARWQAMVQHSRERAWLADSERFADAVELFIYPGQEPAATDHARFAEAVLVEANCAGTA